MITLHYNGTTIDVQPEDRCYRYRAMMINDSISLEFSLPSFVDFPIGTYCDYDGSRYTLEQPASFRKNGIRNFSYTMMLRGPYFAATKYKFYNPADKRLKFEISATPEQLGAMVIDNLNARSGGWSLGATIDADARLIDFNHCSVLEAVQTIANEFGTEYHFVGRTLYFGKIESNRNNPLALQYMTSVKPKLGRENYDNSLAIERLYVQGGERNIDYSTYGSRFLLLPKGQTLTYEGKTYISSSDGSYIERSGISHITNNEDSFDGSDVFPTIEAQILRVVRVDAEKHWYDIVLNTKDDMADAGIVGQAPSVVFQSGSLAGREFDLQTLADGKIKTSIEDDGYVRVFLLPLEQDGAAFPSDTSWGASFVDDVADVSALNIRIRFFGITIPNDVICNNATQTGASWDMYRNAVKYLYEHENPQYSFIGDLDEVYAKSNWSSIKDKIVLGGMTRFTDNQFLPSGELIRIVGIKDYINNPQAVEIELSNKICGSTSFSSQLRELEGDSTAIDMTEQRSKEYARRRWRDARQTTDMLEEAIDSLSEQWTEGINPITARMMQLLVGDEGLQFHFVNDNNVVIPDSIVYNPQTKRLTSPASRIKHFTLGIDDTKPEREESEYRHWDIEAFTSDPLDDPKKRYYIYAVCDEEGDTGYLTLSEEPLKFKGEGVYNLLVGILNSEYDENRSIARLYGFTEILPGQVTSYKFSSPDGMQYLDYLSKKFRIGTEDKYLLADAVNNILKVKGLTIIGGDGEEQPIGVYRGEYDEETTYFQGDMVTYEGSTYICIVPTATGVIPTDTDYWRIYAAKGDDGQGQSTFKSIVFKRATSQPDTPEGGSYESPLPSPLNGWSDGVPDGEYQLWMSTRIFSSDGQPPQSEGWTEPSAATDTADIDIEYSDVEISPYNPTSNPENWHNDATSSDIWMAIRKKKNGVWGQWQVSKIKGEQGNQGFTPYVQNGYWYINGQSTGIKAQGENGISPTIGNNGHWYIGTQDTGVVARGTNGVGISGVTEYYASHTSGTSGPSSTAYKTTIPTDYGTNKPYLWNYERISYTNGQSTTTTPAVVGVYGKDGQPGAAGKGISSIIEHYAISNSSTSAPTTWSTSFVVPTDDKPYLWNYETINYTDGTSSDTTKAIIGIKGEKGKPGDPGSPGAPGTDGKYTEYRYAQNGSTSTPPSLNRTAATPSGWSVTMPSPVQLQYIWMTKVEKNANGTMITGNQWSDPVRLTGYDGQDGGPGAKGDTGPAGPAGVYRGQWCYDTVQKKSVSTRYYGYSKRCDIVKYNNVYYIARIDTPEGEAGFLCDPTLKYPYTPTPPPPQDTEHWNSFGANFESIATGLLLAELAYIDNLGVRNLQIQDSNGKVVGAFIPKQTAYGNYVLWVGGAMPGEATTRFKITEDGKMEATEAKINHLTVTAPTGQTYAIESNGDVDVNGNLNAFGIYAVSTTSNHTLQAPNIRITTTGTGATTVSGTIGLEGNVLLGAAAYVRINNNYTLPQLTSAMVGRIMIIKNYSSSDRTITAYSGQTIMGGGSTPSSFSLVAGRMAILVANSSSQWDYAVTG